MANVTFDKPPTTLVTLASRTRGQAFRLGSDGYRVISLASGSPQSVEVLNLATEAITSLPVTPQVEAANVTDVAIAVL